MLNLEIIKKHEGLRLKAYICPAGVPTIGYGSTRYSDGRKIQMGDVITENEAEQMLIHDVRKFEAEIIASVTTPLNDNQLSALISFAYNVGAFAFRKSTLRKKVNANRDDPTIKDEFMKWVRGGGKILPGLVKRRAEEAKLYFTK